MSGVSGRVGVDERVEKVRSALSQRDTDCKWCSKSIIYDSPSGFWIHAGFGDVDGRNGLYCSPEMWNDASIRKYATPGKPQSLGALDSLAAELVSLKNALEQIRKDIRLWEVGELNDRQALLAIQAAAARVVSGEASALESSAAGSGQSGLEAASAGLGSPDARGSVGERQGRQPGPEVYPPLPTPGSQADYVREILLTSGHSEDVKAAAIRNLDALVAVVSGEPGQ